MRFSIVCEFSCGRVFGGLDAYDRHRIGKGEHRRCRTLAELRAADLHPNVSGTYHRGARQTHLQLGGGRSESFAGVLAGSGAPDDSAPQEAAGRERRAIS